MLRTGLLLTSLILLSASRPTAQERSADVPEWHAARPSPIAIYRNLSGNPNNPGPFHYYYQAPAGASLSAHRHSAAMKITIRSGRKYILMGDLEKARVQRFDAGTSFTIPANTWHVEWWESDTLEEIEGIGPMRSEQASPETPRQETP